MSDWGPPSGFALRRNGSCLSEENSCGTSFDNFHRCCPKPATCPTQPLGICCETPGNCTQQIFSSPHCANESWDLYNNSRDGGHFCCLQGLSGFYYDHYDGVGCMASTSGEPNDTQWMSVISHGKLHIPRADCSVSHQS